MLHRTMLTLYILLLAAHVAHATTYEGQAAFKIFTKGKVIDNLSDHWLLLKYKGEYYKCNVNVLSGEGLVVTLCIGK